MANSFFYSPLGVKPEEVGLGRAEILAQSVTGLLIILATFLILSVPVLGWSNGPIGRTPRDHDIPFHNS